MAISFPRDMPDVCILRSVFTLKRDMSINARRNGGTQVSERADPRWYAEVDFQLSERATYQQTRAWWLSLQGGMNDFYMHDPAHPLPINYRTGFDGLNRASGGSFVGAAPVSSLNATTISITDLPANFALVAGDYVGLIQGAARGLHMIMETVTANGAGAVTITVEPHVKTTVFTGAATVNFDRPVARMMAEPNSESFEFGIGPRGFSFKAIQRVI